MAMAMEFAFYMATSMARVMAIMRTIAATIGIASTIGIKRRQQAAV